MRTDSIPLVRGTGLSSTTRFRSRLPFTAALSAAAALALAGTASAQVDYSVASIEVNQAIQLGSTPLIGGRTTVARVFVDVTGVTQPVDGLIRIFDNGVETANSPVYSDNGPFGAPLAPDPGQPNDSLNFTFLPPTSANITIIAEINPQGPNHVVETDPNNNTLSTAVLNFQSQRVPELAYANVDVDLTGGSNPNPAPTSLIEPGVGDNFIQAIYPTSDWFYHRVDAPTKLWTSSVQGSGSSLISSLAVDRQMMVPIPDYIYGWVNGSIPYNGQATIGGPASMGNTQNIRHQRTFAHEIGHNFGLSHNSTKTNTIGVDVEQHLRVTEGLQILKAGSLNDIMTPGLLTPQAWVASGNYNFFFNDSTFDFADEAPDYQSERYLVAGLWNKETGAIEVTDSVTFTGGELTTSVPEDEANLIVEFFRGGELSQVYPISARSSADECAGCNAGTDGYVAVDPIIPFMAVVPATEEGQPAIDRVRVYDPTKPQSASFDGRRTQSAPTVSFVEPTGQNVDGQTKIAWEATDADGDELTFYLRYSPGRGERMVPLATPTKATEWSGDLSEYPAFVDGKGWFEVLATDGLHTTRAQSAPLFHTEDAVVGNNPWVEIVTPDNLTRYKEGATVILHSSGWDLEDRKITGASLSWSSDVEGFLGTGRLLSVNSLSPGLHNITVVATDSDAMTASDTHQVAIAARNLPDGTICHPDLGFGGPGTSVLTACGGDLSTGTTFDLSLTGALPSSNGWVLAGTTNAPTALFGGTLVPVPSSIVAPFNIDSNGDFSVTGLPGGGGPATLYVQCIYLDGAQIDGWGISNAVQLDFLP